MKISLLTKNVIGICIALTTLFFAGFYYHYKDIKKYQINSVINDLESTAYMIATRINDEYDFNDSKNIQLILDYAIRHKNGILQTAVIDTLDNVIAGIHKPGGSEIEKKLTDPINEKKSRLDTSGDIWTYTLVLNIPIETTDLAPLKGRLVITKSLRNTQELLQSITNNQLIIFLVALLGMILVTIWISTVMLINPIRRISKAIGEVAAGEFSPLPEIDTHDEIGDLIRSFNVMTEKLALVREELEHHNKNLQEKVTEEADKLKLATHQLHQNEKLSALGQLIAGVAHELNNPLAIIMGNSQLLLALDPDDELSRRINIIYQSAERSQKIVQNLLSFARQTPSKKSYVGINGLISDCLELKSYDYKTHKIETFTDFEKDLPKTMADFNQLQQVCIIIFENAQHALMSNQNSKMMRVKTEHKDNTIIIKFSDNGPGIPKDIQNRIFEPFFTTKELGKGTGLGLSIAYGIVNKHDGKFYVESEKGKGTTFVIELPIKKDPTATDIPIPSEEETVSSGKAEKRAPLRKRILIVDDEIEMVDMLFNLLKNEGYRVDTARNGKLALEKLQIRNYDVIICDVKMPVMNGIQFYEILKERKPGLAKKIVFISGDIINIDTIKFLKTCGCMYLGKPFKIESLRNCVASLISSGEYVEPVAPSVFLEKSI
ncbi:MAG: response regulator [Candidatus Zixiibacteriota bacterium]|nr:MAG: response regulator [candidate division Zixibacteria bacterium]